LWRLKSDHVYASDADDNNPAAGISLARPTGGAGEQYLSSKCEKSGHIHSYLCITDTSVVDPAIATVYIFAK
jgi:hypothetical protein